VSSLIQKTIRYLYKIRLFICNNNLSLFYRLSILYKWEDIKRGPRFFSLVSFSSKSPFHHLLTYGKYPPPLPSLIVLLLSMWRVVKRVGGAGAIFTQQQKRCYLHLLYLYLHKDLLDLQHTPLPLFLFTVLYLHLFDRIFILLKLARRTESKVITKKESVLSTEMVFLNLRSRRIDSACI
jgi:hypothetical protein